MGRSEGAVKSLYHRTLLSLRDDFDLFFADSEEDGNQFDLTVDH